MSGGKHIKRTKEAIKRWRKWKMLYDSGEFSVDEIANKFKKPDGTKYSRYAIYKGIARLQEIENV